MHQCAMHGNGNNLEKEMFTTKEDAYTCYDKCGECSEDNSSCNEA